MKKGESTHGAARVSIGAKCKAGKHSNCTVMDCSYACHPVVVASIGRPPYLMLAALLLVAGLAGCTQRDRDIQAQSDANEKRWSDMRYDSEKRSREACLKMGGMVVISEWTGRMSECSR